MKAPPHGPDVEQVQRKPAPCFAAHLAELREGQRVAAELVLREGEGRALVAPARALLVAVRGLHEQLRRLVTAVHHLAPQGPERRVAPTLQATTLLDLNTLRTQSFV